MDDVFFNSRLQSAHLHSNDAFALHEANVLHLLPHDGLCGYGNQVYTQGLGHEREGARDSDVALNDFQLVVLVAEEEG